MLLHVSVTSNHHQVDISVQENDMFSAYNMESHTVSTEHVTSMYCNVYLMMVTCNRNM